jgi:hypothetical protein
MWLWGEMIELDCVLYSTVRLSILINSTPSIFFNSFCGLRQGDLLSSLLFMIVMEALNQMMSTTVSRGFISGFW